jgi:hypothetical protein
MQPGAAASTAASKHKRSRAATSTLLQTGAPDDDLRSLLQVSKHLMEKSLESSQGSTASTNSCAEAQRQDAMKRCLDEAKLIRDALEFFPERFHNDLKKDLEFSAERYFKVSRRQCEEQLQAFSE